jgi:hypothetical protein
VDTSGKMLEDKEISDALATYSVDQLYSTVDVAAILKKRLPEDLQPVSGPVAAGIREFATRAAEQALQSPRIQDVWAKANRLAHTQLVAILKGNNQAITSQNGKVVLKLRPIVLELADRLGLKGQAQDAIKKGESTGVLKSNFGQLEIADSKQLDTARTITKILQGLAWLFSIGTLLLFAIAAYLARGRRWVVVLGYGLGVIAAGLAAIAVRSVASGLVVDQLAATESARVPAEHAWTIATSLLGSIATSVIVLGVLFVLASFIASPADGALTFREAVAPWLRDRPGVVWSVFAAAALLTMILWPPPGIRELVVRLIIIGFAGAGLQALGRKTAREFPQSRRGDWWLEMRQRARRAREEATRRIGSAMRDLGDDDGRSPDDARLDRLERLGELKEKGVLTAAEFKSEKKRLLDDLAVDSERK